MASSYREAAAALKRIDQNRCSLKTAAYASNNPKKTLALLSETLKTRPALEAAIAATGLRAAAACRDDRILLLATYDAVAGRGLPRRAGGKLISAIKARLADLKAAYAAAAPPPEPEREPIPRYLRCNPLRGATRASVRAALVAGGVADEDISDDGLLSELLVVAPGAASTVHGGHALVESGAVILQDKASCFPAAALLADLPPDWRGDVLDACAAPGNKTTHAAALLGTRGKVHAFDRDARRLAILEKRVAAAGAADAVAAILGDFLAVDAASFPAARAVLVDPSCSGSGMPALERTEGGVEISTKKISVSVRRRP